MCPGNGQHSVTVTVTSPFSICLHPGHQPPVVPMRHAELGLPRTLLFLCRPLALLRKLYFAAHGARKKSDLITLDCQGVCGAHCQRTARAPQALVPIHPSLHPSILWSVCPSIHPSICSSVHLPSHSPSLPSFQGSFTQRLSACDIPSKSPPPLVQQAPYCPGFCNKILLQVN